MLKRLFDVIVAASALLLMLPVLIVLMLLVCACMGVPVFFRQARPGLHGDSFNMVKFRTMSEATDRSGSPLPDAKRLTRLGRFLRTTSLDELSELWNVFKGDMSLVGPRPLLMEYLPLYSAEQYRRHDVRPA